MWSVLRQSRVVRIVFVRDVIIGVSPMQLCSITLDWGEDSHSSFQLTLGQACFVSSTGVELMRSWDMLNEMALSLSCGGGSQSLASRHVHCTRVPGRSIPVVMSGGKEINSLSIDVFFDYFNTGNTLRCFV